MGFGIGGLQGCPQLPSLGLIFPLIPSSLHSSHPDPLFYSLNLPNSL